MDFPSYVPEAARKKINSYLDGEPERDIPGFVKILEAAEANLSGMKADDPARADQARRIKALSSNIDCLLRLGNDTRMIEAYELLGREFTSDEPWEKFIAAAWGASQSYTSARDGVKRAEKLAGDIASTAKKLSKLIRQLEETGVEKIPKEFHSIPDLLHRTDNHEMQGHNLRMWQALRPQLLGDLPAPSPTDPSPPAGESRAFPIPHFVEEVEHDPRLALRYAWDKAPDFPALLDAVGEVASQFKPRRDGVVGAAIKSRKQSDKQDYLRAFVEQMEDHGFDLTFTLRRAIAVVADVVINQPGIEVTHFDVRDAIAKSHCG